MGTDMHFRAQRLEAGQWIDHDLDLPENALYFRDYATFAALADVRNTYGVPPIAPPRGLPEDMLTAGEVDPASVDESAHHTTWLTLTELLEYDWEGPAWQANIPGIGRMLPLHERTRYFRTHHLRALQDLGPADQVRLVLTFC